MRYHFNTWYFNHPTTYPTYLLITDIKSYTDPEGYWGWRFEYHNGECAKEWSDDNSSPETWEDEDDEESCKEEEPSLEENQKIEIFKDLFSI